MTMVRGLLEVSVREGFFYAGRITRKPGFGKGKKHRVFADRKNLLLENAAPPVYIRLRDMEAKRDYSQNDFF
jgi:hypothetical protein